MPAGHEARSWLAGALLVAARLPPVAILVLILLYAHTVPYDDQWPAFAPAVIAAKTGTLRAAELWRPTNEHRPLLPKVVMLALARLSGWDVRWEALASWAISLLNLGLALLLVRRTVGMWSRSLEAPMVLVASVLLFSPIQYENWTWSWQLCTFMSLTWVLGAAVVICRPLTVGRTLVLALLALAASLTFASGLALWALLPIVTLLPSEAPLSRRVVHATTLLLAGAIALTAYLHDLAPLGSRPLTTSVTAIGPLAQYVVTYLGALLAAPRPILAAAYGSGGLVCAGVAAFALWRREECRPLLSPWLLLAAFSLASAGLTAVGRLESGSQTASLSRYTTFAVPFWLAAMTMVSWALSRALAEARSRGARAAIVLALGAVAATMTAGQVRASIHGVRAARYSADDRSRDCLAWREWASDGCLARVGRVDQVRAWAAALERHGLGPYRTRMPLPRFEDHRIDTTRNAGAVAPPTNPTKKDELRIAGTASTAVVLVTIDRRVVASTEPQRVPGEAAGRFDVWLRQSRIGPGSRTLELWGVVDDETLAPIGLPVQVDGSRHD